MLVATWNKKRFLLVQNMFEMHACTLVLDSAQEVGYTGETSASQGELYKVLLANHLPFTYRLDLTGSYLGLWWWLGRSCYSLSINWRV